MKRNKGISLIVLVITIIVIIILAGAVILSLANNNPILQATKATFLSDVSNFQAELTLYETKQFADNLGLYNPTLLQADETSVTYDSNKDTSKTINDLIPALGRATKYAGKFKVVDGILVFQGSDINQQNWSMEAGIQVAEKPKVIISVNPTGWTTSNVTLTITYSEDTSIKEYSLDGINWNSYITDLNVTTNGTTIYARGKDISGNVIGNATFTVNNIDKVLPTVVYSINGGSRESASTKVTVNDSESGVNASTLQYVWDTQNVTTPVSGWTTFTNGATLTKTGTEGEIFYLWTKAKDNSGNEIISKTNKFTLVAALVVNSPLLATGMTAKKWNATTSTWDTVDDPVNDTSWYDYRNKEWANAQTADGSMWVWIPRYIYKITNLWGTASTINGAPGGTIVTQFTQGINDNWNSAVIGNINTATGAVASNNTWTNQPAFTFGTTQLTGIWVAKFVATAREGVGEWPVYDNVTTKHVQIVPGVVSWRNAYISTMFTVCRNMETDSTYGWGTSGTGIDTHLTKNVEWGAIVYLGYSQYGRNGSYYSGYGTGNYAGGPSDSAAGYKLNFGDSTTGNIYGVYDIMTSEHVSAYADTGRSELTTYGNSLVNSDIKYRDVYYGRYGYDNYYYTIDHKGDAIYEITGTTSAYGRYQWFGYTAKMFGDSYYPPFAIRCGFFYDGRSGQDFSSITFRPILCVESGL